MTIKYTLYTHSVYFEIVKINMFEIVKMSMLSTACEPLVKTGALQNHHVHIQPYSLYIATIICSFNKKTRKRKQLVSFWYSQNQMSLKEMFLLMAKM